MGISAQEMITRLQRIKEQDLQKQMDNFVIQDRNLKREKINELKKGQNPDGSKIGDYRSPGYARFKFGKNSLAGFGNVDLILTGAFSNSLFPTKISPSHYIFGATDSKRFDLIDKYGYDIMGLNQNTFDEAQKKRYAPKIINYIKKRIGQ